MIDLGALLRVPCVEVEMGFDVSPDGEHAVFSWNPDGRWEIYEISLVDKAEPSKISLGLGGKFHPQYSPDGTKLAYIVDVEGGEAYHLIVQDLATRDVHDLTPDLEWSLQANFCWSPDGNSIAFISDQSGQFNVYCISSHGGETRLIFDCGYPAWKVWWSPNGLWLAVTVEAGGIDYDTYIVPTNGIGNITQILVDDKPIDAGQASWSPNSGSLAFTSEAYGFNNIGIYDLTTGGVQWITNGDGEKQYPAWSPDGSRLTYILNRGTISWLVIQKIGESPQMYQVENGVHYLPHFTPDGDRVIFAFDNPSHPDDLWSLSLKDGSFTQLTHSLPVDLAGVQFYKPDEILYPGMDGTPIPALLFRPPTKKPGPAIILIHGGPDWFFEMTWYPLMAHMASRGWVVLAPNYRGSTGYGRVWQEASRFDFGGVDNDDVVAGAYYLIKNNLADPKRIGITGRSHGGYLTMTCLTKYPDIWATGSAVVPYINWFTNHELIRPDLQHWDYENFGDPVKDHDLWVERSPYFILDKISAPVQLIAGRLDQRCPVSDCVDAHKAMHEMGKTVELLIYEDEGHTFLKMENVQDSEHARITFLAKYLEN